jgi:hypothetical protein
MWQEGRFCGLFGARSSNSTGITAVIFTTACCQTKLPE